MIDGPIIGIRLWLANRNSEHPSHRPPPPTPGLKATNATYVWQPGVNEAHCNSFPFQLSGGRPSKHHPFDKPIPLEGCVCGFHAFYSFDELNDYFVSSGVYSGFLRVGFVGLVRGWGNVQLHPNGWRSKFAEPMALFKGFSEGALNDQLLPQLADTYDIPVLSHRAYPGVLDEFGTIVPHDLRPKEPSKDDSGSRKTRRP